MSPPDDPNWPAAAAVVEQLFPGHTAPEWDRVTRAVCDQWRACVGCAGVFTPAAVYWVTLADPPRVECDPGALRDVTELLANHLAPPALVPSLLRALTNRRYAYFVNDRTCWLVARVSPHRRRFLVEAAEPDD